MPPIRQTPFFRGSVFRRLVEGMFSGCHRFRSNGLFQVESNIASETPMSPTQGLTTCIKSIKDPENASLCDHPMNRTVEEVDRVHITEANEMTNIVLPSQSYGLSGSESLELLAGLDFELEYPDSVELSPATWTHRELTPIVWYPTTPPEAQPFPIVDAHLANTYLQANDDSGTLGLPVPYPAFTIPSSDQEPATSLEFAPFPQSPSDHSRGPSGDQSHGFDGPEPLEMLAGLNFEPEFPDSFELHPATWARRDLTSVVWYPTTPLISQPPLVSDTHPESNYVRVNECHTLGLPLPYPAFTMPPNPDSTTSLGFSPLPASHSDSPLDLSSPSYDDDCLFIIPPSNPLPLQRGIPAENSMPAPSTQR